MEKIIYKFEEECALKSKLANFIWKGGIILNSIIYCIVVLCLKWNWYIALYFASMFILLIASKIIYIQSISNKLGDRIPLKHLINKNVCFKLYYKINKFQKDWITKYCKQNKLDSIEKIQLLMQELKSKRQKKATIYINPIIIGTLSLTIWEIAIQKITDKIGFWNMLPIAIIISIGVSVAIGWLTKEIAENRIFFNQFEKFSEHKRLEELLLYRALKCKK